MVLPSPHPTDAPAPGISLTVLPSGPVHGPVHGAAAAHPKLKKSKVAKWRAAVLIGVYVIMIAHIIQWLITGMTL